MDKKVEEWYVDAHCDLIAEFRPCTTKLFRVVSGDDYLQKYRGMTGGGVEIDDVIGWGGVVMDGVSREGWRQTGLEKNDMAQTRHVDKRNEGGCLFECCS